MVRWLVLLQLAAAGAGAGTGEGYRRELQATDAPVVEMGAYPGSEGSSAAFGALLVSETSGGVRVAGTPPLFVAAQKGGRKPT